MTSHAAAQDFQRHRVNLVRRIANLLSEVDEDQVDLIYTDLWFEYERAALTRRIRSPYVFLYVMLKNRVLNYIRDKRTSYDALDVPNPLQWDHPHERTGLPLHEVIPDTRVNEHETQLELHERIEKVLSGIPLTLVSVGTDYHVHGITQEEIARKMYITRAKVVRLIHRFEKLFKDRYLYLIRMEAES